MMGEPVSPSFLGAVVMTRGEIKDIIACLESSKCLPQEVVDKISGYVYSFSFDAHLKWWENAIHCAELKCDIEECDGHSDRVGELRNRIKGGHGSLFHQYGKV